MAPGILITDDNRSPLIDLVTWTSMSIACLFGIIKVVTKWVITRRQEADDAYMAIALIMTIALDISVSLATNYGLGKHSSSISDSDLSNLQKSVYASQVFYPLSICLSKMPILQFLKTLARRPARLKTLRTVIIVNLVSMFIAFFCVVFQCAVPTPWAIMVSSQCFNKNVFWDFFGAVDVLIDLAIVALPVYLLHDLHINKDKKISAMVAFAVRLMTIPLVILRLVYLARQSPIDPTFSYSDTVIVTSAHANVSIVAACIPFFKPIMDSMQSGVTNSDLRILNLHRGGGGSVGHSDFHLRYVGSNSKQNQHGIKSVDSSVENGLSGTRRYLDYINSGSNTKRDSSESRQKMIIRADTTIDIVEEDKARNV